MRLPVLAITSQCVNAVLSKLGKRCLEGVFLHRYNNPIQMKPKPNPEPYTSKP